MNIVNRKGLDFEVGGYLALACCIWGGSAIGKNFTVEDTIGKEEKIKKALGLVKDRNDLCEEINDIKDKPNNNNKKVINKIDVSTNEVVQTFSSIREVCDYLKMSYTKGYEAVRHQKEMEGYIYTYSEQNLYKNKDKNKFLFENVKTGTSIVSPMRDMVDVTTLSLSTLYLLSKNGKTHKTGWKVSTIRS